MAHIIHRSSMADNGRVGASRIAGGRSSCASGRNSAIVMENPVATMGDGFFFFKS